MMFRWTAEFPGLVLYKNRPLSCSRAFLNCQQQGFIVGAEIASCNESKEKKKISKNTWHHIMSYYFQGEKCGWDHGLFCWRQWPQSHASPECVISQVEQGKGHASETKKQTFSFMDFCLIYDFGLSWKCFTCVTRICMIEHFHGFWPHLYAQYCNLLPEKQKILTFFFFTHFPTMGDLS